MKNLFKIILEPTIGGIILGITISLLWIGCTSTNPSYIPIPPGQINTNTVPQFIPNLLIESVSNTVGQVAGAVTPLNPYASLTDWAIKLIFAAIGGISGFLAQRKNTSTQQAAADVLAGVVVKNNLSTQALVNAGNVAATVAQHIDNNTTT